MVTKLEMTNVFANLRRSLEWGRRGISLSTTSAISKSPRTETACGQAGQGRREGGKGSAHQCVTRRRPTDDAEMRRATGRLSAIGVVAVVGGTLLLATPALALSKHTYKESFAGSGSTALTNPDSVAVEEATGDLYVSNTPKSQQQTITVNATGGTFTLTFKGKTTLPLAFDAPASQTVCHEEGPYGECIGNQNTFPGSVEAALEALPGIGKGGVHVHGPGNLGPYTVEFKGSLDGPEQPPIASDASGLTGATHSVQIATTRPAIDAADVEKFTSSGEFLLIIGREVNQTKTEEAAQPGNPGHVTEAEEDLCTASQEAQEGDTCRPGAPGSSPGAFQASFSLVAQFTSAGSHLYLAVDNSCALHRPAPLTGEECTKFDPSAGDLYVADPGDDKVSKFDSEGHLITTWGQRGQIDGTGYRGGSFSLLLGLQGLAVDPADGDLFVAAQAGALLELAPGGAYLAYARPSPQAETNGPGLLVDAAGDPYQFSSEASGGVVAYPPLLPGANSAVFLGHPVVPVRGLLGMALDPYSRDLYIDTGSSVEVYPPTCVVEPCSAAETFGSPSLTAAQGLAVSAATGAVYVANTGAHDVAVFAPQPYSPRPAPSPPAAKAPTEELLTGEVDPAGAGPVSACRFEYTPTNDAQAITLSGATGGTFTLTDKAPEGVEPPSLTTQPLPFDASAHELESALAPLLTQLGRASAEGEGATVSGPPGGPYRVEFTGAANHISGADLSADSSGLTPPAATVTIENQPGGDWATASTAPCEEPSPPAVKAPVSALRPGTAYEFRLRAENASASATSYTEPFTTLPLAPTVGATSAGPVFAEAAQVHTQIDSGGGEDAYHTSYHVEYLTAEQFKQNEEDGEEEFTGATQSPSLDAGSAPNAQEFTSSLSGLQPDTTYHYRLLASNQCEPENRCEAQSAAHTFTTLPLAIPKEDPCQNSHVRQQTGASQLLDCRAYELVSAPHTAGYDVESNLIEGQAPYAGYPYAVAPSGQPRVLYGIHDGGIPGLGEPTNRGTDPYIATRTPQGWVSEYVGIPADATPSTVPFGSPLLEADPGLGALAFGGAGLCSPCFSSGIETGIPLRLAGSEALSQGMAGPLEESSAARSDGYIAQRFSADGAHFVFGSTSRFAEGGNEEAEENVSIYDRDLRTGETHLVSDTPGGEDEPLPCLQGAKKCHSSEHPSKNNPNGIAELAISSDGSHTLLAQKVSEDADHNVYWHLYMNVGDSKHTIDLTPGVLAKFGETPLFKAGVLFDGMSADGSKVFFTTADKLLPEDQNESADLYEAEVSESGATLHLISPGDTASCDPVSNANGPHWNALGAEESCGVLAIGGGGGVASESGAVYFLSPEQLQAGHGIPNQPNLYLAVPGVGPRFIATLEPEDPLVLDSLKEAGTPHTADFQVTPNGEFAAFPSTLPLAGRGEQTAGQTEVYRYDASGERIACASCTFTETPSEGNSSLASDGTSLTEDGRLFFNSDAPLVATDTDEKQDVYEWEEKGAGNCSEATPSYSTATDSCRALISAGTSATASGLLSADASGKDVYFFTRDKLAEEDENGPTVKVYDARTEGGFPYTPPRADCKASDECHGPASSPPPPIEAGSEAGSPTTYEEPAKGCRKGYVKKHGACVKKPSSHKHKKRHKRAAHHKRGGKK
jgi:DNA-binding beta-propeller fold protein YncE